MALSIFPVRMPTLAHVNVFQPYERIQHWVSGHQFWTLATVAEATGIRHQGCRVGEGWQSLISVNLIALWVLTYFVRPFD